MKRESAGIDYREIARVLRDEIRRGAYSGSGAFPSLTRIMSRFGVTRMSAVRSVAELKRLGLVGARKGSGTYVLDKNRTIGLVIPGTADSEFFVAVTEGLVEGCAGCGMDLVAGDVFPVDHRLRSIQAQRLAEHMVAENVAGVIMQPVGFAEDADRVNATIADILDRAGIPLVLVDYDIVPPPARSRYDLVATDHFAAGRKIAAHLVSMGVRRVCCLLRRLCADSVHARFAGVDATLRHSAGRHADIIVAEPDDVDAISAGIGKYRPEAIVCSNDMAAAALAKTLRKLRVRVPRDMLLAGFDDVKLAGAMKPGLTSVRQYCDELSSLALRTLLERMRAPSIPPRKILLDSTLVVRRSTLCMSKAAKSP